MTYERISPTAAMIAWLRSEEQIDYARAVALLIDVKEITRLFFQAPYFDLHLARLRKLGPWAALRFFALQKMVFESRVVNVLELASGLSPSGLIMSEDYPDIEYLETDLPDMHAVKAAVVKQILEGRERANLRFMSVDVTKEEELVRAMKSFSRPGPVCVANEGLLQYFTYEEKQQLAHALHGVLPKGSAWITTDIVRKGDFERAFTKSEYLTQVQRVLTERTGRDMVECAFDSFDQAEALFIECGFSVERHRQFDIVPKLLAPEVLARHPNLEVQQVWKLTPQ